MFENVGKKIMGLAKVICWINIILCVISAILIFANSYGVGVVILYGFLVLILGPLFSWITSWVLYAFGQMSDDIQAIRLNTRMKPTV